MMWGTRHKEEGSRAWLARYFDFCGLTPGWGWRNSPFAPKKEKALLFGHHPISILKFGWFVQFVDSSRDFHHHKEFLAFFHSHTKEVNRRQLPM
jgi:hypothetical protein